MRACMYYVGYDQNDTAQTELQSFTPSTWLCRPPSPPALHDMRHVTYLCLLMVALRHLCAAMTGAATDCLVLCPLSSHNAKRCLLPDLASITPDTRVTKDLSLNAIPNDTMSISYIRCSSCPRVAMATCERETVIMTERCNR